MALGKWQKKTIVELYREREREAWYFKALAILTAGLILLGYLVFAQAFSASSTDASTLIIVAAVFLALGYSLSVALWFICRSWLFQLEVLFIPCLFSCIFGTLNAGITIAISNQGWTSSSIASIALGVSSSFAYAGLAYLIFRKVERVRNHDKTSTRKRESSENLTLLPEEELQRQNLLRLLVNKQENRSPQQTYRIHIPDDSVALRTPPPLTAPLQGLGLSGTLGGPATPYESQNVSQNASIGVLPISEQFAFQRGNVSEPAMSSQRAALEAARQKARIAQARAVPPSPRNEDDSLPWPPVIVNTRHPYGDDISDIPLSERHPLERQGHIPGRSSKDKEDIYGTPGVYRSDENYGGHDIDEEEANEDHYDDEPTFEIVEGANIQVDLTKDYTRQQPSNSRSPNPSYNPLPQISMPGLAVTTPGRESRSRSCGSR